MSWEHPPARAEVEHRPLASPLCWGGGYIHGREATSVVAPPVNCGALPVRARGKETQVKCVTAALCWEQVPGKLLALSAREEVGSVRARPEDLPTAGAWCQGHHPYCLLNEHVRASMAGISPC